MTNIRSGRPYQRLRRQILTASDICWLCDSRHCPKAHDADHMARVHHGRQGADTIDHVIPLALGGDLLDPRNVRPAHFCCNSRKRDKVIVSEHGSRMW